MELIKLNNVKCYIDENGTAQLNLEDVARGLGFTTIATSGNECIRWSRVNEYLVSFGFLKSEKEITVFIPENIFYRLAMKAKSETAEKFQIIVCDEILPQIRKTGSYQPKQLSRLEILELALQSERKVLELESKITQDAPKVIFADAVTASNTCILVGELAKILKQNGHEIGQNRLFSWLRGNGYLIKRNGLDFNMPTQLSMELKLFEIKETAITHSDGHITISKTVKINGKGQIYFVNRFANINNKEVQI